MSDNGHGVPIDFDGKPFTESEPGNGAEILDKVMALVRKFIQLSDPQARIIAIWIPHTYAMAAADTTPYLHISSATKQSGKTRLLEVLELLVAQPWLTGRVTAACLTRKVDQVQCTLLLDESDAAFNGDEQYSEALRGILNGGFYRGGVASCVVGAGANMTFQDFSVFCAKAIAGIGSLPDTVADRSIPIRLQRKLPGQEVTRFRRRSAIGALRERRARGR